MVLAVTVEFAHFVWLRSMGSCANDMAQIASGVHAAHWGSDLNAWDIAPGALLIREAGGTVTDYNGEPWTTKKRNFIASNDVPALHEAVVTGIRTAREGCR